MKRTEQENFTDFKAIRAKFQEEITLNQYRRKPMVPEKPRQIPLPPGACPSHLSTIAVETESKSSVLPRAKKHGKRPVSYPLPLPPCTPSLFSGKTAEKEQSTRQTSKDKRLSLGLPLPGKEQKVILSLPLSSCLPSGQPGKMRSPENDVKSTSPKTSGISLDASSQSKSPSNSAEMTSGSPSPKGRGCIYSRSTSAPSVCSTFEDASVRHSTLSSAESAQDVNGGSPETSSPPWFSLKASPKLSLMGCEGQKAEAPPQKPKSVSQTISVSALAAKLNIASHWKVPHIHKDGADCKTNCLQLGQPAETGPAKIPLPELDSLDPPPEKPPRPHLVDLGPCWALFGKDQHEIGVGVLESIDFEGQAPEYPVPPKPQDLVCPELAGTFNVAFNAIESQAFGAADQGLDATDLEPRESKSAVLEVLGLWTKGSAPALDPPDQDPPAQNSACVTELQHKDAKPLVGLGSERHSENADNVYEDVEITSKLRRGQNTWRRKVIPKNPYADTEAMGEDSRKSTWFHNPWFVSGEPPGTSSHGNGNGRKENRETNEDREQKKREKKERREREKKENEMRRKFKITGQEEPMYKAKVTVTSKGRKGDLPVQTGDIVSIIRTTDCPKGKWLARDDDHMYGYIPVMNVELDIKEMLELGKRASQAAGRPAVDGDTFSDGSRSSNQCRAHSNSFTDSEEWTCDEESISSPSDVRLQSRTVSMAEMCYANGKGQPAASDGGYEDSQALTRYEALQKLATFFQQQQENESVAEENEGQTPPRTEVQPIGVGNLFHGGPVRVFGMTSHSANNKTGLCLAEEHTSLHRSSEPEGEFQLMDLIILPPPAPFADRG